ncbi:MAG: hypothetical protein OXF56_02840 [Rhodobacteraceae bacterium]|nr:hypothetical protein [Paracoccaceae bacterium]
MQWGPIYGYSIIPPMSNPSLGDMADDNTVPNPVIDLNDNECFDGLGNCDGAFIGN